jgi:pimeloyl-ACP methyl ester carboxylesterase
MVGPRLDLVVPRDGRFMTASRSIGALSGGTVQPETRYARLGQDRIAYQVLGQGPPDLVLTTGPLGSIDLAWEEPGVALFFRMLSSFSRLILFDRLGSGASDPLPSDPLPPRESHAEELVAVLDAVGSERTAIMAHADSGPMAIFFAATTPERTSALVLANSTAKYLAADDYPIGVPREVADTLMSQADQIWGTEALAAMYTPSRAGDKRFLRWHAKVLRTIASPKTLQAFLRTANEIDARPMLPLVQAPTLVLHRGSSPSFPSSMVAIWPNTSLGPRWSNCQGPMCCSCGRPPNSSLTRSNSSSPACGGPPNPSGCWPPCCSPTSSPRPSGLHGWATGAGASC